MTEPIFTTTHWKVDDLESKTVEFRIPATGGFLEGVGQFRVSPHPPTGRFRIEIVTNEPTQKFPEMLQRRYQLPQEAVDRIARHPNPEKADFLLR